MVELFRRATVDFPDGRYRCIGYSWRGRGPWRVIARRRVDAIAVRRAHETGVPIRWQWVRPGRRYIGVG